jgi:hypothetical protein
VVVGGVNGVDGTDNAPGEPGADGTDGTPATALAIGGHTSEGAVAIGGDGGRGGDGGDEIACCGAGIGGDGGNGGDDDFGFDRGGARGGRGGDGGTATASAQGTATAGGLSVGALTLGGDGGAGFRNNRGGDGGLASASASAVPELGHLYAQRNTVSLVTGRPLESDIISLLAEHASIRDALGDEAEVVGHGLMAAGYTLTRYGTTAYSALAEFDFEILLGAPVPGQEPPGICLPPESCIPHYTDENVLLALLGSSDAALEGEGEILFQVFIEGELAVEEFFTNHAAALAYFDDSLLDFGPVIVGADGSTKLDFDVVLEYTRLPHLRPGFDFEFAVAFSTVPEPGTALMLGLGLLALAARRRAGGRARAA